MAIATKNQINALRTLSSGSADEKQAVSVRTYASLVRRGFASTDWETGDRKITMVGTTLLANQSRWDLHQAQSARRSIR